MVVIALMCLFLALTTDTFFTLVNLFDLLNTSAVNVIFAAGLLVVLIAGGIDISFAVAASVVQYLTALTVDHLGGGNWAIGFAGGGLLRLRAGGVERDADLAVPDHLDRRDHRDLQPVLRRADVLHAGRVDLRPAGLVAGPHHPVRVRARPTGLPN